MKSIISTTLFSLFTILTAIANPTEPTTKKVDTTTSTITWLGEKVLGSHTGDIKIKEGNLEFVDDQLSGGSFTIDMTTINTTDLEGKGAAKLNGHLKSDDFFGVEAYPTATFVINKVAPRGKAGEYKITGEMTIKGITKEIKFNAVVLDGNAAAQLVLDRTDFNVKYGSGSFFDSLGDKTIYDEFTLTLNLNY